MSASASTTAIAAGAGAGGLVVLVAVVVVALLILRRREARHRLRSASMVLALKSAAPSSSSVAVESLDIPRSSISIERQIGAGVFGEVFLATYRNRPVAVKMQSESATPTEKEEFLAEMDLLRELPSHPHVVRLVGVCVDTDSPLMVLELMELGNLRDFLRESRARDDRPQTVDLLQLFAFCLQVAQGMEHLAKHKVVHRDLAARNVLLNRDRVCKIADFGLARDLREDGTYVRSTKNVRLPVKWMAPESIRNATYTTASDVWSFGVLIWEVFELGASPYWDIELSALLDELSRGRRLPQPEQCGERLYALMRSCWSLQPKARPTFSSLCQTLAELREECASYDSVYVKHYAVVKEELGVEEGAYQATYVQPRSIGHWMENSYESVS